MSRLPPKPALSWRHDGTPVARDHDDVYFSAANGLEESRAVFLAGCHLPKAWEGRSQFTIGELGFGTGLNFLAVWDLWRKQAPSPKAWLHFVSFEGYPLDADQAAQALSSWPSLTPLAEQLVYQWPARARGVQRIDFPQDRVSLTLHIDEVEQALKASALKANAWFLDGFSPAKNEAMWANNVLALLSERSAPGAHAATFTVAGAVRRGLEAAGFAVEKRPGYGRKRERLEATYKGTQTLTSDLYGLRSPAHAPERIAILGAGIAGACAAYTLKQRGCKVTVFDPSSEVASGASGNPIALLMPRLDASDTVQARLLLDAYLHARRFYAPFSEAIETEVQHIPKDDADRDKFLKILRDPPLPLEDMEALQNGGILLKRGLILKPVELVKALLETVPLELGAVPSVSIDTLSVNGQSFDVLVFANGMAVQTLLPSTKLTGKLGQVDFVTQAPDAPSTAIASGHYALSHKSTRLWGATFETHEGPALVKEEAQLKNQTGLSHLSPWWLRQIEGQLVKSRASIRATTPDKLPLIGAIPDEPKALEIYKPLRQGKHVTHDAPLKQGVYVLSGYGSRGFTWGPWAATALAAQLFADPRPTSIQALEAVSPMRFIHRGLKRNTL